MAAICPLVAFDSWTATYCPHCGLEIEIINPCTGFTSGQVLRCCGRDMTPEVGASVHLESES